MDSSSSQTPQKRPLPPSPSANLHLEERFRRRANPLPKGLQNLGNTCFMNSALQCLTFTAPLTSYFLSGAWEKEVNKSNPLGMEGRIPMEYANLVGNLWFDDESTSFSPRTFKRTIGERNPTFVGYGQQDSQELFQSLLDGLHEDLNRILKREYVEDPDYNPEKMTEDEFARICWDTYKKRNNSIIVDLFQGQLKSRTECQNCKHISIKFDPYMYLQLPIPEPEASTLEVMVCDNLDFDDDPESSSSSHFSFEVLSSAEDEDSAYVKLHEGHIKKLKNGRPRLISVKVPRNCSIGDLKLAAAKKAGWTSVYCENPDLSYCADVFNCEIYKIFENTSSISNFAQNDKICIYQASLNEFSLLCGLRSADTRSFSDPPIPACIHLQSSGNQMGFPAIVSLPDRFSLDSRIARNIQLGLGPLLYKVAVTAISRFSILPLFRKVGSGLTRTSLDNWTFHKASLSFYAISEDWEPIPDLFTLEESGNPVYNLDMHTELLQKQRELFTPDGPVSSPKSEMSDLVNNFKSSLDTPTSLDVAPSADYLRETAPTEYRFRENSKLTLSLDPSTAKLLFGEDSGLFRSTYNRAPSIFDPTPNSEPVEQSAEKPITLNQCMDEFTKVELLDGNDTMYCSKCKEHQPTKKQLSVYSVPEILVIHLKRFSNSGRYSSRSKLDNFVDAPLTGLDMSEMIDNDNKKHIYDLFAVSNHFGGLGGGHYTAYTLNPIDQKWYNCDDSHVSEVSGNVVTKAAYLLLYRKRGAVEIDLKTIVNQANEKRRLDIQKQAISVVTPSIPSPPMGVPALSPLGSSSPLAVDFATDLIGPQEVPSETGTVMDSPSTISEAAPLATEEFDPTIDQYISEYP